jgi:hypothetical protein
MTDSKIYINNLPFVDWKDSDAYKKLDHTEETNKFLFNNTPDYEAALHLLLGYNETYTGFIHTECISGNQAVMRRADLITGIHIKKPGISYKIYTYNQVLVSGISTGEPILFGNMYYAEENNEVTIKNVIPLISLQYRSVQIDVSEEVDICIYYVYLEEECRRAVARKPNNIEVFGKKYRIKSNEIVAVEE